MPDAKISIIVPVYKVEPYLRKCLDSIVGQTYQNLEIILVDDGSPDNCGAICDAYAARDERIRVIHKANGGVASARNAGLDAATGDYIGWVDSDDWIERDMFECLLKGAEAYGADIVVCGREDSYPDHSLSIAWEQVKLLDKEQSIALLVEDDLVRSYLWDKLWRRKFFQNIRFPELKAFEDMAMMYQLFMRAERVACLPDILYHYEHRDDSLVAAPSFESRVAFFRVNKERYEALERDFPQLTERLTQVLAEAEIHIWTVYYDAPKAERRAYDAQIKDAAAFCREHYKTMREKNRFGLAGRIVLRLTPYTRPWAFALARLVSKLYEARHGRPL